MTDMAIAKTATVFKAACKRDSSDSTGVYRVIFGFSINLVSIRDRSVGRSTPKL
jgi:hypothetical protein